MTYSDAPSAGELEGHLVIIHLEKRRLGGRNKKRQGKGSNKSRSEKLANAALVGHALKVLEGSTGLGAALLGDDHSILNRQKAGKDKVGAAPAPKKNKKRPLHGGKGKVPWIERRSLGFMNATLRVRRAASLAR